MIITRIAEVKIGKEEMETTRAERLPVNERDRHVCVFLGGESDGGMINARESATRKLGSVCYRLPPNEMTRPKKKLTTVSPIDAVISYFGLEKSPS